MSEKNGYTYSRLCTDIDSLLTKYPFIHASTVGKSLVGRDIPLVSVGNGKKSLLYVGTHHGMEWLTALILIKYLEEYCRAVSGKAKISGVNADIIFETRKIYVIPMLNPDGAELQIHGCDSLNPLTERLTSMSGGDFSRWQANGRGVDLNHNYNAGFAEYKLLEPSLDIHGGAPTRFSGAYPESEPETSALCGFIRATDVSMLLALHTQGGEIYADYNGLVPPGGSVIAERMSALSGYKVAKPEPAACYGGLKDWYILEFNRPGFTIECGYGKNPLPESDGGIVYSQIRKILLHAPTMI